MSDISGASFVSSHLTTTAADLILLWGPAFRHRIPRRFPLVAIDIGYRSAIEWRALRCSAAYITNIAWRRMLPNAELFRRTAPNSPLVVPVTLKVTQAQ